MKPIGNPTDADLILSFYQDENPNAVLPQKLAEKVKMMEFAYDELKQHRKPIKVVAMMQKRFKITKGVALVTFREMELVFGKTQKKNKEFWRNMIVESIWDQIGKAIVAQDSKAASALYDRIIKALGLEKDDEESNEVIPAYQILQINYQPHQFGAGSDGSSEEKLKELIRNLRPGKSTETLNISNGDEAES